VKVAFQGSLGLYERRVAWLTHAVHRSYSGAVRVETGENMIEGSAINPVNWRFWPVVNCFLWQCNSGFPRGAPDLYGRKAFSSFL